MKKLIAILLTLSLVLVLFTGCKGGKYDDAKALYEAGKYAEAAKLFKSLGDYEDSKQMLSASNYALACEKLEAGDFDAALKLFTDLGDYEDSAVKVSACNYGKAVSLMEAGDYEGAIALFDALGDYEDAAAQRALANAEIQYQSYGEAIDLLCVEPFFANSGTVNSLYGFTFTKASVCVKDVFFDGNGYHTSSENTVPYLIDDTTITMTLDDGRELSIPYTINGGAIKLGSGEYFSASEVDAALQGYWHCIEYSYNPITGFTAPEYNAYIHDGTFEYEHAIEAYGYNDGSYYYYGPYEDSYTLGIGCFESDIYGGNEWFFNIIDGEVKLMHYDHVFDKVESGMPGEDGYSF